MNRLTLSQKKAISDRILKLDPNRKLVTVTPNAAGGSIAYNKESGIILNQFIS
jgi:hypothetical protein